MYEVIFWMAIAGMVLILLSGIWYAIGGPDWLRRRSQAIMLAGAGVIIIVMAGLTELARRHPGARYFGYFLLVLGAICLIIGLALLTRWASSHSRASRRTVLRPAGWYLLEVGLILLATGSLMVFS